MNKEIIKNNIQNKFKALGFYYLTVLIIGASLEYFFNIRMNLEADIYYSLIQVSIIFLFFSQVIIFLLKLHKPVKKHIIISLKYRYDQVIRKNGICIVVISFYFIVSVLNNIQMKDMNGIYAFVFTTSSIFDIFKMLLILTKVALKD